MAAAQAAEEAEEAAEEAEEAEAAVGAAEAVGAMGAEAAGGGTPYQEYGDAPESMRSPSMQMLTTAPSPPSRVASTEAIFGGVEGLRSSDARVQAEAANRLWQVRRC
jgi:hypothetical protein